MMTMMMQMQQEVTQEQDTLPPFLSCARGQVYEMNNSG
jgi:hypothetical protein